MIDAVWFEGLHLYCLSPVTLKTDWPRGCLTGARQDSRWAELTDEAGQDAASSLPASRSCSCPLGCPHPPLPTCPITQGQLCPPRGKRWINRAVIDGRHNGLTLSWVRRKTDRTDGLMMYLQTGWWRKTVTAGGHGRVRESRRRNTELDLLSFLHCTFCLICRK